MWRYISTDELYHHGVIGMKWGVRRYQNKDGTLTPLGQKKAKKTLAKYEKITGKKVTVRENKSNISSRKKTVKEMSNEELDELIRRKQKENTYKQLYPETVSKGKKFMSSLSNDILLPGIKQGSMEGVKSIVSSLIKNLGDGVINPDKGKKSNTSTTKKKK